MIKYFVSQIFQCLSIQEARHNSEIFECLEEKIFYNLLHIEIELYKIKLAIVKEIKKSLKIYQEYLLHSFFLYCAD